MWLCNWVCVGGGGVGGCERVGGCEHVYVCGCGWVAGCERVCGGWVTRHEYVGGYERV